MKLLHDIAGIFRCKDLPEFAQKSHFTSISN